MKSIKTLIMACCLISTTVFAMGDISVSPIVTDGKYIDVKIGVDCTGCWWSEVAYIKGTLTLRGRDTKTIPINTSMNVRSGEYNMGVVNLAMVNEPYRYTNAVINISVSGANTKTVRVNEILSLR